MTTTNACTIYLPLIDRDGNNLNYHVPTPDLEDLVADKLAEYEVRSFTLSTIRHNEEGISTACFAVYISGVDGGDQQAIARDFAQLFNQDIIKIRPEEPEVMIQNPQISLALCLGHGGECSQCGGQPEQYEEKKGVPCQCEDDTPPPVKLRLQKWNICEHRWEERNNTCFRYTDAAYLYATRMLAMGGYRVSDQFLFQGESYRLVEDSLPHVVVPTLEGVMRA